MLCFPQISTGTIAQLPIRKTLGRRTVKNLMLSGDSLRTADPDAYYTEWELRYSGLTDVERETLESFFLEAGGRLRTFLFLDPTTNLLRWSDDFTKDVWSPDGLLQITGGITDPDGGETAHRLINAAQTAQALEQSVEAPGSLHYVFSAYVRSDSTSEVVIAIDGLGSEARVGHEWRRVICSGSPESTSESIRCRLEIPAGAVIEVYGPQLEAQPMPSAYRRTAQSAGLHPATRFAEDELVFTAQGMDDHSVSMRLLSRSGV